jgi:hypothetical protein
MTQKEREIFEVLRKEATRQIRALGPAISGFSFFGRNHSPMLKEIKKAA